MQNQQNKNTGTGEIIAVGSLTEQAGALEAYVILTTAVHIVACGTAMGQTPVARRIRMLGEVAPLVLVLAVVPQVHHAGNKCMLPEQTMLISMRHWL